jgi:hypothetical protein
MDSEATQEIKRHFDVVAESLRAEVRDLRQDLQAGIQDVRRHSDVIAEILRSEIRIVAEGVTGLDQKFTREFRNVREEFREAISEVKSLLRLSFGDLDQRVRTLEDAKPS